MCTIQQQQRRRRRRQQQQQELEKVVAISRHCNSKSARCRASRCGLFSAILYCEYVQTVISRQPFCAVFFGKTRTRRCTNYYFRVSDKNYDTAGGLGDLISYMVRIFWRSVDIYHVTLTVDPLSLNMGHMLHLPLG